MKKNKKHYDKYKKFDVVYADFGRNPHGVQGGIRPGIVVSCDASNHGGAPQISVVPLSSKLKDNPVHVIVEPSEIRGYALSNKAYNRSREHFPLPSKHGKTVLKD